MPYASHRLVRRDTVFRALAGFAVLAALAGSTAPAADQAVAAPDDPFIVKPYLQLGDLPRLSPMEPVRVLWQAANDVDAKWVVELRQRDSEPWRSAIASGGRLITMADSSYRLFSVPLTRLEPGREFEYRVTRNAQVVFTAKGKTRAAADQPYRFAVTGDTGAHTDQEKRVVFQMHRAQPDFVAIAGDIVYSTGRMVEYREKYFPIYNADTAAPDSGAPLIRSRLSFGVLWQSRRRHRRLRQGSRRPGVFPDLVIPLERPIYAARSAEYSGLQRAARSPQGPSREHSIDLPADGQLFVRLWQFALDVSRLERLRRLVGCVPAQLAGAGSGGGEGCHLEVRGLSPPAVQLIAGAFFGTADALDQRHPRASRRRHRLQRSRAQLSAQPPAQVSGKARSGSHFQGGELLRDRRRLRDRRDASTGSPTRHPTVSSTS